MCQWASTQNLSQNHIYFCDQMVPEVKEVKFAYKIICIRQHLRTMDSFCNYILKVHVKYWKSRVLESGLVKSNNFNQIHNKRMALSSYTFVRPKHKMAGSKTSLKFTDWLLFMIKWEIRGHCQYFSFCAVLSKSHGWNIKSRYLNVQTGTQEKEHSVRSYKSTESWAHRHFLRNELCLYEGGKRMLSRAYVWRQAGLLHPYSRNGPARLNSWFDLVMPSPKSQLGLNPSYPNSPSQSDLTDNKPPDISGSMKIKQGSNHLGSVQPWGTFPPHSMGWGTTINICSLHFSINGPKETFIFLRFSVVL